jgi:hypothetical protein
MAVRRLLVTGGAGFVLCSVVDRWLTVEPTAAAVIFDLARVWDKQVSSQWPPTHACRAGLSTAPSQRRWRRRRRRRPALPAACADSRSC